MRENASPATPVARQHLSNVLPLEAVNDAAAPDATGTLMLAAVLREAISRLPRGQRDVVILKLLEGRSFREIGSA